MVDKVDQAWWELWKPGTQQQCNQYPEVDLGFPHRKEWKAEFLQSIAKKLPAKKAPGPDGISYGAMREWPLSIWGMVATLYELVEA